MIGLSIYIIILITTIILHYALYTWTNDLKKLGCKCSSGTVRDVINMLALIFLLLIPYRMLNYKDKYFSHMAVDRRLFDKDYKNTPEDIFNETNVILQTNEEIENDILEIQKLVFPRPIIVISHINVTYKGKKLHKRDYLITLLEKICKKNKIMFINPTNLLTQFEQSDIMEPDLGHINPITKHILYRHINLCVSYIFQKGDFYKRDPILLHQSII